MILVTGATGTIGQALVAALTRSGAAFRAMVRDADRARSRLGPEVSLVVADLADSAALDQAMAGVDRLILLTGAQPEMDALEINAIEAAERAGVSRIVKVSVPGADPAGAAALQRLHGRIEATLADGPWQWTVLRPNAFMQNLLGPSQGVRADGSFRLPLAGARYCFIDARDIAAAAVAALTGEGHDRAVYDLTGPEALTYGDVAALLSRVTGLDSRFIATSPEASAEELAALGIDQWFVDEILEWFALFRDNRVGDVTDHVQRLTGHAPRTLTAFVEEFAGDFAAAITERT